MNLKTLVNKKFAVSNMLTLCDSRTEVRSSVFANKLNCMCFSYYRDVSKATLVLQQMHTYLKAELEQIVLIPCELSGTSKS